MKIYTKKGDTGTTGLFGGSRVSKDDIRVECVGTFDEVNSTIGLLRVKLSAEHEWQPRLHKIQKDLMDMMSHLARPSDATKINTNQIPEDGAAFCEAWIDELEAAMKSPSDYFLLPGGNEISALCHVARTQMRRGERRLVTGYPGLYKQAVGSLLHPRQGRDGQSRRSRREMAVIPLQAVQKINYICAEFGSRFIGIKREVRCKSGAIPVAVSSIHSRLIYIPLSNNDGKVLNGGASQKTCQVYSIIHGFRVKSMECKMSGCGRQFIFQPTFIFSEGSFN
jgi:ATP:cob(I)alamin adenosyltransferase